MKKIIIGATLATLVVAIRYYKGKTISIQV